MDESKTTHREHSEETLKLALEMQRREAAAGAVYASLARRAGGRGGEVLARVADEKSENAKTLSRYTGKKGRASLPVVWGWRLLSRVFGSSFVISRLEAGEAEARPFFVAIADEIPEAAVIGEQGARHGERLRELLNQAGLRGIGAIVTALYGCVLILLGSRAAFAAALNDARVAAKALFCVGLSAVLTAAVVGYSSRKAASGRARPGTAALTAFALAAIVAALIVSPSFVRGGAVSALAFSFAAAALVVAALAFFAAVVRQETYFAVFLEMLALTACVTAVSAAAAWIGALWFGLNA